MIQLLLQIFSIFCKFGGQFVMPFIFPLMFLIMPPQLFCGWIILLLCFFTPIMTSNGGVNALGSYDGKTRDSKRAFGFAFLLYYICMMLFGCCMYQVACKVQQSEAFQAAAMAV
jgi:hypothetical protein